MTGDGGGCKCFSVSVTALSVVIKCGRLVQYSIKEWRRILGWRMHGLLTQGYAPKLKARCGESICKVRAFIAHSSQRGTKGSGGCECWCSRCRRLRVSVLAVLLVACILVINDDSYPRADESTTIPT
jgi:hypothetical protein